ncbi:hypothetical protein [Mesorhizobium sp. CAU 1732]|uniref:hypothetical protein n=1 Tax=Mesorhizobium sp. CAU 1732 TaxID=3140358 RepID=UPI0032604683
MDAIEKAIRNAFEKGDPRERAFREKVYRSAFAALDKALQANPNVTQAIADRRRQALSARVSEIESEFLPAVPAAAPAPAPRTAGMGVEPPVRGEGGYARSQAGFEPTIDPNDRYRDQQPSDDFDDEIEPQTYAGPPVGRRRGRKWARVFVAVTVLSAIVIGAWWAIGGGLFRSAAERDQSVPNPPQTVEEEDYQPQPPAAGEPPRIAGGADSLAGWIAVFDPADPTTVAAPGDSRAEVMDDDGRQFIRIIGGASSAPILFDVGQGVLEQLAGRRAVFNIVARAEEGQGTQFSVDCNLGELGDCGRKRYAAGTTQEEFLFEITLPNTNPGAGGTIAINPDVENGGKALDIFAIRVSPAQ